MNNIFATLRVSLKLLIKFLIKCWQAQHFLLTDYFKFHFGYVVQISVIKAKIFDEIGMPAGKQKLQFEASTNIVFYAH